MSCPWFHNISNNWCWASAGFRARRAVGTQPGLPGETVSPRLELMLVDAVIAISIRSVYYVAHFV